MKTKTTTTNEQKEKFTFHSSMARRLENED